MGGGYALAWACNDDGLKAIAPYYDANPRPLAAVARSCPVVGSYPEKDFTALSARKLDAELARHDIPHDVKIYPGARHSFFNDRGRAYDPAAAEDPGAARSPSSPSTSASNEPSHQPVLAARFRLCVHNFCEYIS
jgi:carboxymethylenebutenolidase